MERKKALVAAASATLVLATSAAAIAANVSLLGDDDGDVGQLDAETVTNLVPEAESTTSTSTLPDGREVVVIDEWVTDPGAPVPPTGTDPGTAGVDLSGDGLPDDHPTPGDDGSGSGGSSSHDDSDDDRYEDDEDESHEDEHEDDD